jgi:hypothetical protein
MNSPLATQLECYGSEVLIGSAVHNFSYGRRASVENVVEALLQKQSRLGNSTQNHLIAFLKDFSKIKTNLGVVKKKLYLV